MVVDEFVRFEGIAQQTLSWIRPNFFAIRYELTSSSGTLMRVGVHAIGADRHALAETAEQTYRLDVFPLGRPEVPISTTEEELLAVYHRGEPAVVVFDNGPEFRFRPFNAQNTILEDGNGEAIFTLEVVESFPKWKVDLKLEPASNGLEQLRVLVAASCCYLVFD